MKLKAPFSLHSFSYVVAFATVVAVLVAIYPAAKVRYKHWRGDLLTRRAMSLMEKDRLLEASLTIRQALRYDPQGIEENRAMAVLATRIGEPFAMLWWRNVLQAEPDNPRRALEVAQASLRFGKVDEAEALLRALPDGFHKDPAWLTAAAGCALARGNFREAGRLMGELQSTEPDKPRHRFNLACVGLFSPDPATRGRAKEEVQQWVADPDFGRTALRNLAFHYRREEKPAESLKCWDQLARHAALSWEERLQALEIRRLIDPPGATEEIARYEQQAISDPSALSQILVWHLGRREAREALDLLARAGGRTDRDPMLYFIKAEALMQLKDWKALDGLLRDSTTPPLEYLRSALLAHLARATRSSMFDKHWGVARGLTAKSLPQQLILANLAIRWGWEPEAEGLCREIANGPVSPELGLGRLVGIYLRTHRQDKLRSVLLELHERAPSDLAVANDLAALDLLFNDSPERAATLAEMVYRATSHHPAAAVTYGFSLYRQEKPGQALTIYEKLPPAVLQHPSVKLNHALILAGAGRRADAEKLLASLDEKKLKPEEKRLLASYRAGARAPSPAPRSDRPIAP